MRRYLLVYYEKATPFFASFSSITSGIAIEEFSLPKPTDEEVISEARSREVPDCIRDRNTASEHEYSKPLIAVHQLARTLDIR